VKEGGVFLEYYLVPFLDKLQLLVTEKGFFVKKNNKNTDCVIGYKQHHVPFVRTAELPYLRYSPLFP
jgi:hypothetical protein